MLKSCGWGGVVVVAHVIFFVLSPKFSVTGIHISFVNFLLEKKQGFVGKLSQDKEDHLTSNDVYVVISRHLGF